MNFWLEVSFSVKSTYETSSGSRSILWFYQNCYENSTSPIEAVKVAAVSIIDDCAPPEIKYPIKCGIFFAQVVLAVSSGGNPWAVAMAIGSARQIID
mgnify:CR=1 FL=1